MNIIKASLKLIVVTTVLCLLLGGFNYVMRVHDNKVSQMALLARDAMSCHQPEQGGCQLSTSWPFDKTTRINYEINSTNNGDGHAKFI